MIEYIKIIVNCIYCEEEFDINGEICNDKTCEFKDRKHYDAVIDDCYHDLVDHMDICKITYVNNIH